MKPSSWFLAVLAAGSLGGCATSSSNAGAPASQAPDGLILNPAKPAPPLELTDYAGQRVSLSSLRGHVVFVTFVYTHCPDVCPLIVSSLADAQRRLAARGQRVHMLAVTVDPRRDTRAAVAAFLRARDALGRVDYLLGSERALTDVWRRWEVGVSLGPGRRTTGHSSVIYGIDTSGRMAVVYPADVQPQTLAADVPRRLG